MYTNIADITKKKSSEIPSRSWCFYANYTIPSKHDYSKLSSNVFSAVFSPEYTPSIPLNSVAMFGFPESNGPQHLNFWRTPFLHDKMPLPSRVCCRWSLNPHLKCRPSIFCWQRRSFAEGITSKQLSRSSCISWKKSSFAHNLHLRRQKKNTWAVCQMPKWE